MSEISSQYKSTEELELNSENLELLGRTRHCPKSEHEGNIKFKLDEGQLINDGFSSSDNEKYLKNEEIVTENTCKYMKEQYTSNSIYSQLIMTDFILMQVSILSIVTCLLSVS